jgi:Ca2+-transporting ATPase
MILQDDNYATIVKAVRHGREIYDNIRKIIKFQLSTNLTELALVAIIVLAGMPLPLLPLQILWMNLVTDSLPALALTVDNPDPNIMQMKPRKKNESLFSGGLLYFMFTAAIVGTIAGIFTYFFLFPHGIEYTRTMVLTVAVMFQMIFVFNCRSETHSVFGTNVFSNAKLLGAVAIGILLQIAVVYLPFMQNIFSTVPLSIIDWGMVIALSFTGLLVSPLFFKKLERDNTT